MRFLDFYLHGNASVRDIGKWGGKKKVKKLIKALKGCNAKSAIRELGEIGDIRAVEPLINALWSGRYEEVSEAAADALGKIGDIRAVEPLIRALTYQAESVRKASAKALDKLGWKSNSLDEKIIFLIAKEDLDEIVKIGKPCLERLIDIFERELSGGSVNYVFVKVLEKIGDDRAIKPLIAARNILEESQSRSDYYYDDPALVAIDAALKKINDKSRADRWRRQS